MGDLVILDDVRSGPLKSRDELLLEWRLLGEQLDVADLAARLAAGAAPRRTGPHAKVLPLTPWTRATQPMCGSGS
jgi:hypothetical protein